MEWKWSEVSIAVNVTMGSWLSKKKLEGFLKQSTRGRRRNPFRGFASQDPERSSRTCFANSVVQILTNLYLTHVPPKSLGNTDFAAHYQCHFIQSKFYPPTLDRFHSNSSRSDSRSCKPMTRYKNICTLHLGISYYCHQIDYSISAQTKLGSFKWYCLRRYWVETSKE